eukprot:137072-Rhodomonas_salina.4
MAGAAAALRGAAGKRTSSVDCAAKSKTRRRNSSVHCVLGAWLIVVDLGLDCCNSPHVFALRCPVLT